MTLTKSILRQPLVQDGFGAIVLGLSPLFYSPATGPTAWLDWVQTRLLRPPGVARCPPVFDRLHASTSCMGDSDSNFTESLASNDSSARALRRTRMEASGKMETTVYR